LANLAASSRDSTGGGSTPGSTTPRRSIDDYYHDVDGYHDDDCYDVNKSHGGSSIVSIGAIDMQPSSNTSSPNILPGRINSSRSSTTITSRSTTTTNSSSSLQHSSLTQQQQQSLPSNRSSSSNRQGSAAFIGTDSQEGSRTNSLERGGGGRDNNGVNGSDRSRKKSDIEYSIAAQAQQQHHQHCLDIVLTNHCHCYSNR
jgi:hypothetical protein